MCNKTTIHWDENKIKLFFNVSFCIIFWALSIAIEVSIPNFKIIS